MVGVRQFDEEEVLTRALDLFRRKGLRATSMLDLAQATGVQRGSLYNAYGGKEELFLRAFDRYAGRFLGAMRAALAKPDLRQALTAFFDTAIASMTGVAKDGAPARGCLSTRTAAEVGVAEPRIQERLRALLDEMEAIVETALSAEAARRRLTLPPAEAARLIVTFTRGLAVIERVYGDPRRLREIAASLIQTLVMPT